MTILAGSWGSVLSIFREPGSLSGLFKLQAHTQCTDVHTGKTVIRAKYKGVSKNETPLGKFLYVTT